MSELERKFLSNEQWKVEMRRAYSLDLGYLKMKYPEIARGYVKEKVENYIEDKDKKTIREKFPDAWNSYSVELTPRLIIKKI